MNEYLIKIKKGIKNSNYQNEVINIELTLKGNNIKEIEEKLKNNIIINENDYVKIIEI